MTAGHPWGQGEKSVDADVDNSDEAAPEDLAGRVCYEHEPLVLSWKQNDWKLPNIGSQQKLCVKFGSGLN